MAEVTDRARSRADFLATAGWQEAALSFLAGDASNRSYARLVQPDGRQAVLMDAPPGQDGDIGPFVRMADYLTGLSLSAPQILARDAAAGWLLLEDLGDALFVRHVDAHPCDENLLYTTAVDALAELHRAAPPALAVYDAAGMSDLSGLAFDWYAPAATGTPVPEQRAAFRDLLHGLLSPLDSARRVVVLRDFHAENLIWLPQRAGAARVGLLDFQDAMLGHPAYDLVSLLQDARRDVSPALEARMIARFVAHTGADRAGFEAAYALLGAQRALRILGVFARLCLRDGKAHYVDLIPRVWGLLQRNLAHPAARTLEPVVRRQLPAPDPALLSSLRMQCASNPAP